MVLLTALVALGTLLSGVAAVGQLITRWHLQSIHKELNGRMDEQIAMTRTIAHAEGVAEAAHTEDDHANHV